jgi:hypothetical protein
MSKAKQYHVITELASRGIVEKYISKVSADLIDRAFAANKGDSDDVEEFCEDVQNSDLQCHIMTLLCEIANNGRDVYKQYKKGEAFSLMEEEYLWGVGLDKNEACGAFLEASIMCG